MYRTNIDLLPAGPFTGQMVVTMRPIPAEQIALAKDISTRFPQAHGAPIAIGDPAQIGIDDLSVPDWATRAGGDWATRWNDSVGTVVGVTIN